MSNDNWGPLPRFESIKDKIIFGPLWLLVWRCLAKYMAIIYPGIINNSLYVYNPTNRICTVVRNVSPTAASVMSLDWNSTILWVIILQNYLDKLGTYPPCGVRIFIFSMEDHCASVPIGLMGPMEIMHINQLHLVIGFIRNLMKWVIADS